MAAPAKNTFVEALGLGSDGGVAVNPLLPGDEKVSSSFTRQKTLVEGFMDVTLMGKNAATFKLAVSLLSHGDGFVVAVLVLTILSLISQLFLAGFLFRLYKKRSTQNGEGHQMNRLNNITYGLTLVIVFINVFIVAFEIKAV